MTSGIKAFIVGYTGESGKELVKACMKDTRYAKLVLIGRRQVELSPEAGDISKCEQVQVDFDNLENSASHFTDCSVGYCCLGTTRGKSGVAGFEKVDRDYILKVAEMAHTGNCPEFHLVSSQGANANSSFLYPRVKGEVETKIRESGWFNRLFIYRPGVLMCNRQESRPAEHVFRILMKPISKLMPTLCTTSTEALAEAMVQATFNGEPSPAASLEIGEILRLSKALNDANTKQ